MYHGAVTIDDVREFNSELDVLLARVGGMFGRKDSRRHARDYIRGLLAPIQRKNGWTIAEYVGEREPKALQRFLNLSPWDVGELLQINREYVMERLSSPEAILVADPTGFAKKGTKSVGVQRQYSGTLGRIGNCQIATFLAYVTPQRDRALIDRRLYLPRSWIDDPDRCTEAGVPEGTAFKTRPQQVIDMIGDAVEAGVPFAWFTADEEFGQKTELRDFLQSTGISYVMAIPKNTVFTDQAGRHHQVCDIPAALNHTSWQRRACGIGSKGYRIYDWAMIDANDPEHQYLLRRSIDDTEIAYYHCYNPKHANVGVLVHVAGARWPIEECFGSGKNEVGLDNYQVRQYGAWHRHITLAMLAHSLLAVTAHAAKKRDLQPTTPPKTPTRRPTATPAGPNSSQYIDDSSR